MPFFKLLKKYRFIFIVGLITLLWFAIFKAKPIGNWDNRDIVIEGIYFFSSLIGYLIVRKLEIQVLNIGWELFTTGLLIDFFDEFTHEPDIISTVLEGIITAVGLLIIAIGFYRTYIKIKEIKESMKDEHTLLRTLMDSLPDYIFIKDNESRFITTNVAHLRILGVKTLEEVIGKTDFAFFPREQAEQYYADEQTIIRSGQPLLNRVEEVMERGGGKRWFLTTKIPRRNESGKIIGIMGISRDITERKKAEKRIKSLSRFYKDLGKAVNQSQNMNELSKNILQALDNLIDCDMSDLLIYDPNRDTLTVSAQLGYPKDLEERTIKELKVGKGEIGVASFSAFHRKAIYIENMKEHKLLNYVHDLCEKYNLQQMYVIPLIGEESLSGVLQFVVKEGKVLSEKDRELLDIVSEEIAAGITKINDERKIKELAIKDYLTGLYNRRYFQQKLKEQKIRNKRYGEVYSIIYLDIDNFKECNDTYGHLEGDSILQILGKILRTSLREVDFASRYGGEEFVIILPHAYKEEAKQIAERIYKKIHQSLYPKYKITVSMGIADSTTSENVVDAADKTMYEAKREGKDMIKIVKDF